MVIVLSTLPLVSYIEAMLQSLHSFFIHSLKEFPRFINFVKTLEIKGVKLLKNVKTQWISMLSKLKCVMVDYKALIVRMHFNRDKTKFASTNFELLCDLN